MYPVNGCICSFRVEKFIFYSLRLQMKMQMLSAIYDYIVSLTDRFVAKRTPVIE